MGVKDTTFVTEGEPIIFYVDLKGEDKQRITSIIQVGGGRVTADYDDSVVVITDKNLASSDTKIFLPPAYVEDSAAYGQQVFQEYALPPAGADNFAGRTHYTDADDRHILAFVAAHPHLKPTGNTLWQEMEKRKITKHSWNSLRTHYSKILLPKTKYGDVVLTKKKKSTQDEDDNTYAAFTLTANSKPKFNSKHIANGTHHDDQGEEEQQQQHNGTTDDDIDLSSQDINANDNMDELLEHLLNSDSPPSPTSKRHVETPKPYNSNKKDNSNSHKKSTTKIKTTSPTTTSTSTTTTPTSKDKHLNANSNISTPASGARSKRNHSHSSSSSHKNTTPANHSTTYSDNEKTPMSSSAPSPSSSSLSSSSAQHMMSDYSSHNIVYSASKRGAATERNMRGTAKRVRGHMYTVADDLQLPVTLVYHAYLVHSGDPVKALNYLLANPLQESERPWLPSEDKALKGNNNSEALRKVMSRHGKDNCEERANFLESSTTSTSTTTVSSASRLSTPSTSTSTPTPTPSLNRSKS